MVILKEVKVVTDSKATLFQKSIKYYNQYAHVFSCFLSLDIQHILEMRRPKRHLDMVNSYDMSLSQNPKMLHIR
ncbi:hypothetical protein VIGAN_02145300 [Vigna angularis var. angularis]|uniref:Uncharacterized protein n=1 Tax=Vigna angularis var. angularis TaxID=157739 RepID=A0A0S3RDG6_PHAAN|nr:hypothetical protein VIGAN_02145300 [Vigna angularis var. angularis]